MKRVRAAAIAFLLGLTALPAAAGPAGARALTRAPSGPPLISAAPEEADQAEPGSGQADPLVENGLSSPLCSGPMSTGISSAAKRNCSSSSFVAAPAPTGNYGIDVNIDVGPLGVGSGTLLTIVQDLFVTPIWNTLVWAVHALLVMLEWCYTLDLLDSSSLNSTVRVLHNTQASLTQPWLAFVLASSSVLALYNGLIRRRIAETLGQALLTIAMMAAGLWVIVDPIGTIGSLGRLANEASLGTLSAVTDGVPENSPAALADSLRDTFVGTVRGPWCYLEFGDVRWCEDAGLLDASLRRVALSGSSEGNGRLLREARTNSELFLAFPVNGPIRNSFKQAGSLLHAMCKGESVATCNGPMAAEAAFRTSSGTFPRMIGVVGIAIGVIGAMLMLGFIALRLLSSSVTSIFLLLLAPAAVLAPALGDGGRAVFLAWATKLLGAVTSKLLYSFLLGVLFLMQRTLTSLQLGWWTEWLLLSAFWWGTFVKRHQLLSHIHTRGRRPLEPESHRLPRLLRPLDGSAAITGSVRWVRRKMDAPSRDTEVLSIRKSGNRDPQPVRGSPSRVPDSPEESDLDVAATQPTTGANAYPPLEQNVGEKNIQLALKAEFERSPVLKDAREVERGHKRYLGYPPES